MVTSGCIMILTQKDQVMHRLTRLHVFLDSIVVSIPACHAGDRGSIPRRGVRLVFVLFDHNLSFQN